MGLAWAIITYNMFDRLICYLPTSLEVTLDVSLIKQQMTWARQMDLVLPQATMGQLLDLLSELSLVIEFA